ncbi:MAG: GTPase ObgE, partial [Bacteroidota bacterium]
IIAMFHDEVELYLVSGKGGDGAVSFRREKYIPKGGPDGGDGGSGGNVVVTSSRQLSDLNHLASVRELQAEPGVPGSGRKMAGRNGADLVVSVPVGTRLYRREGEAWRLVFDFTSDGAPKTVLRGGEGGLGNVHFASATNQTPRTAQPGEPGERTDFRFELQLIADVGIIGMPNSGKSTFLSIVSDAKPKIGDYPFTTLSPVLGVVEHRDRRYVFADIPGLIEGASRGKGLGLTFLRHIKRTKILLHFIDCLSNDYVHDYRSIRHELEVYDPSLLEKKELVVITKGELVTEPIREEYKHKIGALRRAIPPASQLLREEMISAVTGYNIKSLLDELHVLIDN